MNDFKLTLYVPVEIVAWDVCEEKGHRWSGWVDYFDGRKWRKYRVCSVCQQREDR